MKHAILIGIFISISLTMFSQELNWKKLLYDTIHEITYENDSLVNMTQIPYDFHENNGLIYRVASTEFYDFQNEEWVKEIVTEYLETNQIKDNRKEEFKYAITIEGDYFELKKHNTEKRYYYGEGSGVLDYTIIKEDPGRSEEEIFCIFNDSCSYPYTKFKLTSISPLKEKGIIKPNQSCHIKIGNSNYILEYTADFCETHFQVEGFGTIAPTFYNVELKVIDVANGTEQIIWQIPHEYYYWLRDIEIGDINHDNKQDIVLTIINELCIKRILYLSNNIKSTKPFRYIGIMIIYCDYP